MLLQYYIFFKNCLETKKKGERERKRGKSPGKSPALSHRHLSFPVPLTHLTDFQSLEPICWERNPTLARNETTSTLRHTTTPQRRPSPPPPSSSIPSSFLLSSVSRHIKGLEEKHGDSLGRLYASPLFILHHGITPPSLQSSHS